MKKMKNMIVQAPIGTLLAYFWTGSLLPTSHLAYFILASFSPAPERVASAVRTQICNLVVPTEPVEVHGTLIRVLGGRCQPAAGSEEVRKLYEEDLQRTQRLLTELAEDSHKTRKGFTRDLQRTYRGCTEDSHRTYIEFAADQLGTHRGFTQDSYRTHTVFTEDSQNTHEGPTEDSQSTDRGLMKNSQRTYRTQKGITEDSQV